MGRKRRPGNVDVRHAFNSLRAQVEDKRVVHWTRFCGIVHVITGYNEQLIVRNINCSTKFKMFIQAFPDYIILVFWHQVIPLLPLVRQYGILKTLNIVDNFLQLPIHDVSARVLVNAILILGVLSTLHARTFNIMRNDILIELLGNHLHAQFVRVVQKLNDFVKDEQ